MKKRILCVIIVSVFLTACGSGTFLKTLDESEVNRLYSEVDDVNARARIFSASDSGAEFEFVLDYSRKDNDEAVTVVEPDEISGIAIPMKDGIPQISGSYVSVEDGLYPYSKYTAVNIIPLVFRTLTSRVASDLSPEKLGDIECTAFTYTEKPDGVSYVLRIWLDNRDLKPAAARVYADGTQTLNCDFLTCSIG